MIGDEINIKNCRTCDSEFSIEAYNIDEEITYCPFCGSTMSDDFEEEFYDDDNL